MTRFCLLAMGLLLAQSGFEVASIKPTDPALRGRWVQMPPEDNRIMVRGMSLKGLIQSSYGLPASLVIGGPDWANRDRYDIVAKAEGHRIPTQAERTEMLKTLLADRFHLKFHRESKESTVFTLVIGKNGPKMTERKDGDNGSAWVWPTLQAEPSNFRIPGRNISMPEFANLLQSILPVLERDRGDRVVLDKTGLPGRYDFTLLWAGAGDPNQASSDIDSPNVSNLFAALQQQLGLKLETTKAIVEAFVIDHAEKPEN